MRSKRWFNDFRNAYLGILVRVCTVNLTQSLSERASDISTHNILSPSVRSIGTVPVVLPPVGPGPNGTTVSAGVEVSITAIFDEYSGTIYVISD